MSRTVRKQLFEILHTLHTANEMLEGLLTGIADEAMLHLLTDCQNCAITMGNKIESIYGTGTASVKILEEYCESIFLISRSLDRIDECRKHYEQSRAQLQTVQMHMEQELPDKKEVVFMPYKASMWDALESVYLAAKEDEDCETYVVPIPYFDRKADKSLGEMHCEGSEYPSDIPITDWEQYSFEERLPDVIYIHNAYDDMNLVTCVHPRFFSSNLKKYTGKLVYIPYFVLEEIEPDDQKKIDSMKHFCVLPGIIHADKVILQSENMCRIYINEYAKAIEEAGGTADRKQLRQKFMGTGSPKFDKVLNTKKEDLDIPEEWLKIIQKSDGSFKKIIFYNTGVTALLQHGKKVLWKIKYVFDVFRKQQEEVLLWRPHPLIMTTIESMCPQLKEEYMQLVEEYRAEGWGIYDDTPDMNRAVILSDAYYGDQSSIVELYRKTGKPVMIQNVCILPENKFKNACLISRGVEFDAENSVLWMVTNFTSSLLKIDLETGELLNIFQIPVREIKDYGFIDVKKADEYLYIPPYNAEHLYCFSIREETFIEIQLPLSEQERAVKGKFRKTLYNNGGVYFIGWNIGAVIKLDLVEHKMKRIEGFGCDGNVLAKDGIIIENNLFMPFAGKNMLLKINTLDDSWEEIEIENSSNRGFPTITGTPQEILLTDKSDHRISYCLQNGKVKVNNLQIMSHQCMEQGDYSRHYEKVFWHSKKEYYFPICDKAIWRINEYGEKKELLYEYPFDTRLQHNYYSKFEMLEKHGNMLFFQVRTSGDVFKIDLNADEISKYVIKISEEEKKKIIIEGLNLRKYDRIVESDIFDLESYFSLFESKIQDGTYEKQKHCGEQIYI